MNANSFETIQPAPRSERAALGLLTASVALAALLLAAPAARAQCTPSSETIDLAPVKAGLVANATGTAGRDAFADCGELFGVNLTADLPDGDRIMVMVTASDGTATINETQIFGGVAQLIVATAASTAKPATLTGVSAIQGVQVYENPNPAPGQIRTKRPILRQLPLRLLLEGSF